MQDTKEQLAEVIGDQATASAGKASRGDARRTEILAFIILAILIWPVVTGVVVGGYGFLVWMSHLVFGPPGPPH